MEEQLLDESMNLLHKLNETQLEDLCGGLGIVIAEKRQEAAYGKFSQKTPDVRGD